MFQLENTLDSFSTDAYICIRIVSLPFYHFSLEITHTFIVIRQKKRKRWWEIQLEAMLGSSPFNASQIELNMLSLRIDYFWNRSLSTTSLVICCSLVSVFLLLFFFARELDFHISKRQLGKSNQNPNETEVHIMIIAIWRNACQRYTFKLSFHIQSVYKVYNTSNDFVRFYMWKWLVYDCHILYIFAFRYAVETSLS